MALAAVCLTLLLLSAGRPVTGPPLPVPQTTGARLQKAAPMRPVAFEPAPSGDGFFARTAPYDATVAAEGAVFRLKPPLKSSAPKAVRMSLVGAQAHARIDAASPLPGKVNYLLGNDPATWRRNVPTYARVLEHDAWPGVDVAYYGTGGRVETDFVVAPDGDPGRIVLDFAGARDVRLEADGSLQLTASDDQTLTFLAPSVYQVKGSERTDVSARYVLDDTASAGGGRRVHFALGAYDHARTLVIDPLALVVAYSTYVDPGGSNLAGTAVAVDDHGRPFVAGIDATFTDNSFPVPSYGFVTKYSSDGQDVLWTTFIGEGVSHSVNDVIPDPTAQAYTPVTEVTAIALDGERPVITGATDSPHFPTTAGAFHNPNLGTGGVPFAFVAKLTADGDDLVYSAYPVTVGRGDGVALDQAGRAFVVGTTYDFWLPTTPDALIHDQPTLDAGFLLEFSVDGSTVVFGTFLGSRDETEGFTYALGVAVDPSGATLVVGKTYAHRLVTKNAFQPHNQDLAHCPIGGGGDGFIMKFSSQHRLVYSSYLGGGCADRANAVAAGPGGSAYVTGSTEGYGFTCLPSGARCDTGALPAVFVVKVHPDGHALAYSTILGGGEGRSIAESQGHAYATGWTTDFEFPRRHAIQPALGGGGGSDAFVTELRDDGSGLVFSTFLGGSSSDQGNGIAVGANGGVYVTGVTDSADFPTHRAHRGHNPFGIPMAFLTKLKLETINPEHH